MKFLKYILVVFLYTATLTISNAQDPGKHIVVIDPGHGGTDSGVIGVNGVKEKDIVLSIAKKVDSLNEEMYNNQFDIYLTRYKDTLISLRDITKLAKRLNADAFISLHCNQAVNKNAKGIEVFVYDDQKFHSQASVRFASSILNELEDKLDFSSRGVKLTNFQVLRETADSCPAVLVELGFLSSYDEARHLTTKEKHNGIAVAILESIIKK